MILKLLLLLIWLFILPTIVGCLWTSFLPNKNGSLLRACFYGIFSMLAIYEILAVPMVFLKCSLTRLTYLWAGIVLFLALLSIIKNRSFLAQRRWIKQLKGRITPVLLAVVLCIGAQMAYVTLEQNIDDDDSFYLATSTVAVEKDSLYRYNPYTGAKYNSLPSRYVLASWPLFIATASVLTGFHPVVLAHTLLPGLIVLLAYIIYALIAARLFAGDKYKQSLFLLFIVLILSFSGYSRFTAGTFLFVRGWQGKAMLAGTGMPAMCYTIWCAMKEKEGKTAWLMLSAVVTAACLFSSMGVALSLVLTGACGLVWLIREKHWRCLLYTVAACLPAFVCGAAYVILQIR